MCDHAIFHPRTLLRQLSNSRPSQHIWMLYVPFSTTDGFWPHCSSCGDGILEYTYWCDMSDVIFVLIVLAVTSASVQMVYRAVLLVGIFSSVCGYGEGKQSTAGIIHQEKHPGGVWHNFLFCHYDFTPCNPWSTQVSWSMWMRYTGFNPVLGVRVKGILGSLVKHLKAMAWLLHEY